MKGKVLKWQKDQKCITIILFIYLIFAFNSTHYLFSNQTIMLNSDKEIRQKGETYVLGRDNIV